MTFRRDAILLAVPLLVALVSAAAARPARCTTTDEGDYACEFAPTGRDGSFSISAPGKPTYTLEVAEPGVAFGFVRLGGRNVALPGRFRRSASESGCWLNDETRSRVCAR